MADWAAGRRRLGVACTWAAGEVPVPGRKVSARWAGPEAALERGLGVGTLVGRPGLGLGTRRARTSGSGRTQGGASLSASASPRLQGAGLRQGLPTWVGFKEPPRAVERWLRFSSSISSEIRAIRSPEEKGSWNPEPTQLS